MDISHSIAVDQVFVALADNTRRNLLERIAREGPASASLLASHADISRQAIAKHLTILEAAGLVAKAKRGREVLFQAQPHQLAATGRWMQRMAQRWEDSAPITNPAAASHPMPALPNPGEDTELGKGTKVSGAMRLGD